MRVAMSCTFTLALLSACNSHDGSEAKYHLNYLAVQKDKGAHWSIIDGDGATIVKEEYAPDNSISRISDDGLYWVQSGGKFMLYSVKQPKHPVSQREFDAAHDFLHSHTFAIEKAGKQIELIDKKGKTIKLLPKNVFRVYPFHEGMAQYMDVNGKWGYIDIDGDIKIKAKYDIVNNFSEGYAIVKEDKDGDYSVINAQGKIVGVIKADKYSAYSLFQEGLVCCDKKGDNNLLFLDKKGAEAVTVSRKVSGHSSGFFNGLAVLTDWQDGVNYGIIDKQGNFVVRMGKYDNLLYTGDGYYIAEKDDKYGIIDGKDNEIVEFRYTGGFGVMLGDNFIMSDGKGGLLVDKDGNEVRGSDFAGIMMQEYNFPLNFYDLDALAVKVANLYSYKGYEPLPGIGSAEAIAKQLNVKMEDCKWLDKFKHKVKSGVCDITTEICLDRFATKTKYRTVKVNDGWFEYNQQVEDGLMWNNDAKVTRIRTIVSLTDPSMAKNFVDKLLPMFTKRGFTEGIGDSRLASKSKKAQIEVVPSGSEVHVTFERKR